MSKFFFNKKVIPVYPLLFHTANQRLANQVKRFIFQTQNVGILTGRQCRALFITHFIVHLLPEKHEVKAPAQREHLEIIWV